MRLINANELRKSWAKAYLKIANMVDEMPTIDAEPTRHGKWNILEGMPTQCSLCGYYVKQKTFKYCPYCGAKMEGVEE